jgi:endonuclease YncB( thermonuclease family)
MDWHFGMRTTLVGLATALGTAGAVGLAHPVVAESDRAGRQVTHVIDGDTPEVSPPIEGARPVRLLNIDTPEIGGATQEPWATEAGEQLRRLVPRRTEVTVRTDTVLIDQYGRALGHLVRNGDSLNVNRHQLRTGHAVLHVLWPNVAGFEDYRRAQRDAQEHGRGIWDPADPLEELPYEYRLRKQGSEPTKPVGDWFTKQYVAPEDYDSVHVNNRVFFWNEAHAANAGFTACPEDSRGAYDASCFSPG